MPTIIACPNCHQDVALPARVDGPLICPHCEGEFSFGARAQNAAASGASRGGSSPLLPSSVDVSPDAASRAPDDTTPRAKSVNPASKGNRPPRPLKYHDADFSRAPQDNRPRPRVTYDDVEVESEDFNEFDNDEHDAEKHDEYDDVIVAGRSFAPEHDRNNDDDDADDEPAYRVQRPERPQQPALTIDTGENRGNAPRARSTLTVRTRKQRNPLGQLAGVFGGGVLGLAIGYYLLNYFGGPQFNFLNIPLPGIPHQATANDANGSGTDAGANEGQNTADNSPDKNGANPRGGAGNGGTNRGGLANGNRGGSGTPTEGFKQPVFTAEQLRESLAQASRALGCERCQSTGVVSQRVFGGADAGRSETVECPICHGRPFEQLSAAGYLDLCDLARTVTWVDPKDTRARGSAEALRNLLVQTVKSPPQQQAMATFAAERINQALDKLPASRTENGAGIVLLGKIVDRRQVQKYHLTILELPAAQNSAAATQWKQIAIVSLEPAPGLLGESLLVAGVTLRSPATTLAGYDGSEPLIVWGGFPLVVR